MPVEGKLQALIEAAEARIRATETAQKQRKEQWEKDAAENHSAKFKHCVEIALGAEIAEALAPLTYAGDSKHEYVTFEYGGRVFRLKGTEIFSSLTLETYSLFDDDVRSRTGGFTKTVRLTVGDPRFKDLFLQALGTVLAR